MYTSIEDFASEVIDMSTKTATVVSRNSIYMMILSLIVFAASSVVRADPATAGDGTDADVRTSISSHTAKGGRDNPTEVAETTEDYGALVTTGERSQSATRAGLSKPGTGSTRAESTSFDFWFYDADVILFNDDDGDGYYHGIDLLFDADTVYVAADVYAVLYLSFEGGPWNEYAVTEDFTILGASGSDEYVLVTELMSGYPTGSYDLLIELFDAFDGAFLASYGPSDAADLGFLPLEDFDRDKPIDEVRVVVNRGGGGAMDGWLLSAFLLILFASAIRKIWRRRNDRLVRIDSPAPIWQSGQNEREELR